MLALLTLLACGAFHSPHPHAEIVFTAGMAGIFPDSCSRLVLRRRPRARPLVQLEESLSSYQALLIQQVIWRPRGHIQEDVEQPAQREGPEG